MTVAMWVKPFGLLISLEAFLFLAKAKIEITCGDPSMGTPKPSMDFKLSLQFSMTEGGVAVTNIINKHLTAFDEAIKKATKAATSAIRGTAQELASACTGEKSVGDDQVHLEQLSIDDLLQHKVGNKTGQADKQSMLDDDDAVKIPNEELLRDDVTEEEEQQLVMDAVKRIHSAASKHPKFEELARTFGSFDSERVYGGHLLKMVELAEQTGYFDDENDPMPEALKMTAEVWEQVKKEDRAKHAARKHRDSTNSSSVDLQLVASGKYIKHAMPLGPNPHGFGFTLEACANATQSSSGCTGQLFYWAPKYNGQCKCATDDGSDCGDSLPHNIYRIMNTSISDPEEAELAEDDVEDEHLHPDLSRAIDVLQADHDQRHAKKFAKPAPSATNRAKTSMHDAPRQPDRPSIKQTHRRSDVLPPTRRLLNHVQHRHAPSGRHIHAPPRNIQHSGKPDDVEDQEEEVSLDELSDSVSDRVDEAQQKSNPFGGGSSKNITAALDRKALTQRLWHRWHWHVPHRWHWHIPHRWHIHIPHFHIPPPSRWGAAIKDAFVWVGRVVVSAAKLAVQVAKSVAKAAVAVVKTVVKAAYKLAKKLAIAALKLLCKGMSFGLDKAIAKGIKAVAEIGAHCVMAVGKLVSMSINALKDLFRFRSLKYAGSLARMVRGNFGTIEVGLVVAGDNQDFKLECDLSQGWKCIKDGAKMIWGVIKKAAISKFKIFRL
jgi:hypothetical protein